MMRVHPSSDALLPLHLKSAGYELGELIHEGAWTRLFRGTRQRDGAPVILKVPRTETATSDEVAAMEDELQLLRRLKLPCALEWTALPQGEALVHEAPRGETLARIPMLEPGAFLELAIALCHAVGALHDRRVVHGDLQPTGLLFDRDSGEVRFLDFASALHPFVQRRTHFELSRRNLLYLSPEQTGRINCPVDFRADLYALGLVLYELLCGTPPFQPDSPMRLIHAHLAREPAAPVQHRPGIPEPISRILLKLLSKEVNQRYQGVFGLRTDLEQCLVHWRREGRIPLFELGRKDVPNLLVRTRLHGRQEQQELLREALKTASRERLAVVVLTGGSGTGKTSLVQATFGDSASSRLARGGGELGDTSPYQAFAQASRELLKALLSAPDEQIRQWLARLLEHHPGVGVLCELVPELALVMEHSGQSRAPVLAQAASGELSATQGVLAELKRLTHLAFQCLLSSFARPEAPLVLFLNDVQRMDTSSLLLLERLATEPSVRHLLVVAAWNTDEPASEELRPVLERIRQAGVPMWDLALPPLSVQGVGSLLQELFRCEALDAEALAQVLVDRTQGHQHFTMELLRRLVLEEQIRFDSRLGRWRWELAGIRAFEAADNVLELLTLRMQGLSARAHQVLTLAACVGNPVDGALVVKASGLPTADATQSLQQLVAEGFLVPVELLHPEEGAQRFRFVHDRIREAAYSLIPPPRRAELHLTIGRLLQAGGAGTDVFELTSQFNLGREALSEPTELREVAVLNLTAARRAMAAASFELAEQYLSIAESLLPDTELQLSFDIQLLRAECAALLARLEDAEARFVQLMARARTPEHQVDACVKWAQELNHQERYAESVEAALQGLRLLGRQLRPRPAKWTAWLVMSKAMIQLYRMPAAGVLGLPVMTDPVHRASMRALLQLSLSARFTGDMYLEIVAYNEMLYLSLRYGNAPESPAAYAHLAGFMMFFSSYRKGVSLSEQAVRLAERQADAGMRCKALNIYATWFCHLQGTLRTGIALHEEAHLLGLRCGELTWAGFCGRGAVALMFLSGHPLPQVRERTQKHRRFQELSGHRLHQSHIHSTLRLLAILEGEPVPTFPEVPGDHDASFRTIQEIFVTSLLGDHEAALELAGTVRLEKHRQMSYCHELFHFYRGLSLAATCEGPGKPRWRELLEGVKALEPFAGRLHRDTAHRAELLRGELARLRGEPFRAMEHLDAAARLARENAFLHEEALANERLALLHQARGDARLTRLYALEARRLYAQWGSRAKLARLELLFDTAAETRGASSPDSANLDVSTLMTAVQAISGELKVADLLRRLMVTLFENAGAERAFLFVPDGDHLVLAARKETGAEPSMSSGQRLSECEELCRAIVRYVERTGNTVVLEDASHSGPFVADPYVLQRRPRALLCLTIQRQGRRVGILYLENNLTPGAFTRERLALLDVLSAQAAISFENARLYDTLEHRVLQRTEALQAALDQLRQAQDRLIVQEKLASLGALTAGVAHELKNPLNFVTNFADLSSELLGELEEELQRGGASPQLLKTLEENLQNIRKHGLRANQIVRRMEAHSGQLRVNRAPVELNTLLLRTTQGELEQLQRLHPSLQVQLMVELASLPPIEGVSDELARVFSNLVVNACDQFRLRRQSEPSFQPSLTLVTRLHQDRIEIRIRDNGGGVAPAIRNRLFEPFFTTKPPGEGTGLGLSLSREIVVRGYQGQLELSDVEAPHAEFVITLPRSGDTRTGGGG